MVWCAACAGVECHDAADSYPESYKLKKKQMAREGVKLMYSFRG